jgi:hypothetical protein
MKRNLFHIKQIILVSLLSLLIFLSWTSLGFSQWVVGSLPQVSQDWNLWSVSFADPSNGWAVGEDTSNKRGVLLAYTTGTSWTNFGPGNLSASWSLIGVDLAPSGGGWAVGYDQAGKSGVLLHYLNGQWGEVDSPPVSSDWALADVQMISSSEGWAVGADLTNRKGVLIHLINGAAVVVNSPAYSGLNWYFSGVHFTSSSEGWVIGSDSSGSSSKGVLLHYLDGTWKFVSPPAANSSWLLNDLFLTSPSEGWAVGYRTEAGAEAGVLLHYSNGSWKAVTPPNISSNWYLMGVHFTSSTEGWAVGYDEVNKRGVLLHYSNGHWSSVAPPQVSFDWELRSVHFTSSGQGWAVGWDHFNKTGVILRYAAPETITKPDPPGGPTSGTTNSSYIFSTGGSISSIGDPIRYRFDWGDGTKSSFLPVGQTSTNYSWTSQGSYVVKAQAICSIHPDVFSGWSAGTTIDISGQYFPIVLASPKEGTAFDPCSLYGPPTFEWTAEEPFKSYEIQFSPSSDFGKISKKIKATSTSLLISSTLWKGVLLLPGKSGGTVYWRVVGTRADKTIAISQPFSMLSSSPNPVQNPNLSSTSRSALSELNWENACNVKSKVWFGNDPNFTKRTTLNFNVKNPLDNGGVFKATLTSKQWETIRKLVGDKTGETLYWYIECWDGLGRYYKTDTMNFNLTD